MKQILLMLEQIPDILITCQVMFYKDGLFMRQKQFKNKKYEQGGFYFFERQMDIIKNAQALVRCYARQLHQNTTTKTPKTTGNYTNFVIHCLSSLLYVSSIDRILLQGEKKKLFYYWIMPLIYTNWFCGPVPFLLNLMTWLYFITFTLCVSSYSYLFMCTNTLS